MFVLLPTNFRSLEPVICVDEGHYKVTILCTVVYLYIQKFTFLYCQNYSVKTI